MANKKRPSVADLRARVTEADVVGIRSVRLNDMQDWKTRLMKVDQLYRGDWQEVFPDETVATEYPHVMNLVQTEIDDIAKLVTEAIPTVSCPPDKEDPSSEAKAEIRNAIADTYWEVNGGETLVPRLAMDLVGAGCAFVASYIDPDEDYPCFHRIDPRFAYPDVVNGRLQDLLVVEEVNWRKAARLFPELGLALDPTIRDRTIEVLHYYSKDVCMQAVSTAGPSGAASIYGTPRYWDPQGVLPVA